MQQPTIRSILTPTDFSDASVIAFSHALKLALKLKANLDVFHVEPKNDTSDWRFAPTVLETLSRWGVLPAGATEADLEGLGISARRSVTSGVRPDEAIFGEMVRGHTDLVVLSTHGRSGLERWIQPSVATPIALKGAVLVLLIPPGVQGFVNPDTGVGGIRRVLVPVDHRPHPAPGFDAARIVTEAVADQDVEFATLHVGTTRPELDLLRVPPGWTLHHWMTPGSPEEQIEATAKSWDADLVVMVTEGRRNFLDTVRGSTVERLLNRLRCPVLIVPAEWGSTDVLLSD